MRTFIVGLGLYFVGQFARTQWYTYIDGPITNIIVALISLGVLLAAAQDIRELAHTNN